MTKSNKNIKMKEYVEKFEEVVIDGEWHKISKAIKEVVEQVIGR